MRAKALAPAKVNLFLHVGPPEADGYHPVCSLMVFADAGDLVTVEIAERDEFVVEGAFAGDLAGTDPADNLANRAIKRLRERASAAGLPLRITLAKELPVAAGLGGGSSDAAAALRATCEVIGLKPEKKILVEIMAELGADGPACLAARPVIGEGRGDRLSSAPQLPELSVVLVNPRTPCPTGLVYRGYDAAGAPGRADRPDLPDVFISPEELAGLLSRQRNDLEAPAIEVAPAIATVLADLSKQPETLLARLSGSGATCFALCEAGSQAKALEGRLKREHPSWWVRSCRLGGPWPT